MTRSRFIALSFSLLALTLAGATVVAAELLPIEVTLARFETATTSYPDDPALEWAYAKALASAGQFKPAAERLEHYLERWPTRRKDVHLTLGRMLFEAGRTEDARKSLKVAVRADPRSGVARFYHALALRALGLQSEARAELLRSGSLEAGLRADSTLLLSIDAFAAGQDEEGIDLARRVIELDPTSDAAARARMLLWDKDLAPASRPLRVDGYMGFSYDDNVTLGADKDDELASGEDDIRGVWGLGLTWQKRLGERGQLMSGYRFDQAHYNDLNEFNFINNALYVSGLLRVQRRVALRLDLIGSNTLQDGGQFLWTGIARPSVLVALPEGYGLLRGFANFELRAFGDEPIDPSVDQDGWTFGVGLDWTVPIPFIDGTWSLSSSFHETQTEADRSSFGGTNFSGDYDQRTLRLQTRARIPLWWKVELGADVGYSRSWYRHNNLLDFLNELLTTASPEIEIRKRRDHVIEGRLFLMRPLHRLVKLELEWKRSHRMSNTNLFDYKRNIVGLLLRIQSS